MKKILELIVFRPIGKFSVIHQVVLVTLATLGSIGYYYWQWKQTGTFDGHPPSVSILFVPIYEEILFRGIILGGLLTLFRPRWALVWSSFFFGIWHLKNFPWLSSSEMMHQILYASFIFGPLTAWLAIKYKTIWPGGLLHFVNNIILVPLSAYFLSLLVK